MLALANDRVFPRVLEIGTHYGYTTRNLRAHIPGATIVSVDYSKEMYENCRMSDEQLHELLPTEEIGKMYRDLRNPQIMQFYCGSDEYFDMLEGQTEKFNCIIIDGDHSYDQVERDSENAMKHVSPGGTIVWHDVYNKDRWPCRKCEAEPENDDVYKYLSQADFDTIKVGNSWIAYYVAPL